MLKMFATIAMIVLSASVASAEGVAEKGFTVDNTTLKAVNGTFVKSKNMALLAAGEVLPTSLILERTTPQISNTPLRLGEIALPAFNTTRVRCLQPQCVLGIDLSTQFTNISPGAVAVVGITVDGSLNGVLPEAVLGFDSPATTSGSSDVRAFTWLKVVGRGLHTIDVYFYVGSLEGGGVADALNRTLLIQTYRKG